MYTNNLSLPYRHPVHNQYLPTQLKDEIFLYKEGDITDKIWDEEALKDWEKEDNEGRRWDGRTPKFGD